MPKKLDLFNKDGEYIGDLPLEKWVKSLVGGNAYVIEIIPNCNSTFESANVLLLLPDGRYETNVFTRHRT